jgi:uncharacterized membrane protein SpoIIM required for sporulation
MMMRRQDDFVADRRPDWDEFERLVGEGQRLDRLPPASITRAAALYRAICADLMRAQGAGYGPDVVDLLDGLAARGHNALYSAPPYRLRAAFDLLAVDFPRTLRKHARFCALAAALFVLPGLLGFFAARASRGFALHVLPEAMAEMMEKSYAEGFNKGRSEGEDTSMAGFYVYNNIGIAFRCFATGVLLGLGSAFFLVYNGLIIGVVGGLVSGAGHGLNLLTFTCGHSAFELSAIVISGAAGMVMGYALVETNGLTRWASVRRQARDLATLVLGAAFMLLIAALIEGFWSPSGVPPPAKWTVAIVNVIVVGLYFTRAGRTRA